VPGEKRDRGDGGRKKEREKERQDKRLTDLKGTVCSKKKKTEIDLLTSMSFQSVERTFFDNYTTIKKVSHKVIS